MTHAFSASKLHMVRMPRTVLVHVDDLFITSKSIDNHAIFEICITRNKYKEIKIAIGKVVDYIGMTFDLIIP